MQITRRKAILGLAGGAGASGVLAGALAVSEGGDGDGSGGEATPTDEGPTSTRTPEPRELGDAADREDAGNWPTVGHDPGNTGHAPDERGPADGPTAYTVAEFSSPAATPLAVVGGSVFAGLEGGAVEAFSAADGSPRWGLSAGSTVRAAPTVADGVVFVGDGGGALAAVETPGGEVRWRVQSFVATAPPTVDPAPDPPSVYVGAEDGVVALSAADGTDRWHREIDRGVAAAPAVPGDGRVYVSGGSGTVLALSSTDGTEQWRTELPARRVSRPAVARDRLYLTGYGGRRGKAAYALTVEGRQLWSRPLSTEEASAPAVARVGDDRTVYVGTVGAVHALSPVDGSDRWRASVDDDTLLSPVVASDAVYATGPPARSDRSTVVSLSAADGTRRWTTRPSGAPVRTPPAVADGGIYVGDADGRILVLE